MRKNDVIQIIVDVLTEIQSISGRPSARISETTRPIVDLDQFDSLNGVEATVELCDRLGIDLPIVNAFVAENGTDARSVDDIADGICQLAAGKESVK